MSAPDGEATVGIILVLILTTLCLAYGQWLLAGAGILLLVVIALAML